MMAPPPTPQAPRRTNNELAVDAIESVVKDVLKRIVAESAPPTTFSLGLGKPRDPNGKGILEHLVKLLKILQAIYCNLIGGTKSSHRELYYKNSTTLFKSQSECDSTIKEASKLINAEISQIAAVAGPSHPTALRRYDLHLTAPSRGLVYGPISFHHPRPRGGGGGGSGGGGSGGGGSGGGTMVEDGMEGESLLVESGLVEESSAATAGNTSQHTAQHASQHASQHAANGDSNGAALGNENGNVEDGGDGGTMF